MKITVREMVEMAMLVACAVVLDAPFLKIRIGQNGGSISFSMVPLFILAIRHGPIKGFIGCGIVYGLITCALDGWGFQTYPFDYLLGYGSIGIYGLFRRKILKNTRIYTAILFILIGGITCGILRILSSTLSSMILYDYTFVEGVIYNVTYIAPSIGLSIALLLILYKPLLKVEQLLSKKSI